MLQTLIRVFNIIVIYDLNFTKNAEFQMQFSPRRKKIFDFSGRFSESSNDELSAVRQAFLMIFTPSMRKIELKLVRFAILLKKRQST